MTSSRSDRCAARVLLAAALLGVAGCAGGSGGGVDDGGTPAAGGHSLRTVALGYETVTDSDVDLGHIARVLDEAGADTVAISAGRADWTTFPWAGNEDRWAAHVRGGRDNPFSRAVRTVGENREVVAVVDVFASRYLDEHPDAAAVDDHGDHSDFQVSIVELTEGTHGDALVAMVGELAQHEGVDAVSLTELHYDDTGFGQDDEEAFAADTGADGWPRDDDGDIDWRAPTVAAWRSERIAGFVERAARAAHAGGADLLVDVRSPRDEGTLIHGQDYGALLEHADALVIWYYPGLTSGDGSAYAVDRVAREAVAQARQTDRGIGLDRFVLSVGLWSEGDDALDAADLADALDDAAAAGFTRTWVTPWSLLGEDRRTALAEVWR